MTDVTKGLVFLSSGNAILTDVLSSMLVGDEPRREPMDIRLADFDDTEYHVVVTPDDKNTVQISIQMRCIKDILPMGAKAAVDEKYGKMLQNSAEPQYDLTFKFNLESPPYPKADIIKNFAELRRNVLGAPIKRMFDALTAGSHATLKPMLIQYRVREFIILYPAGDRILVYFSVVFEDETDRIIAQVFLQQFVDAPKKVNGAPTITFSKDPSQEVTKTPGFKEVENTVGYLQFQILKTHVDGKKCDGLVSQLVGFRSYLHYVSYYKFYSLSSLFTHFSL
jgi:hypothetical protein